MAQPSYIDTIRDVYINTLIDNGKTERALELINSNSYTPITKLRLAHGQMKPSASDCNNMINEICKDTYALLMSQKINANQLYNLMITTKTRLDEIKKDLEEEKEKLEDTNILCNNYSNFDNVIQLDNTNVFGIYSYEDGIFTSKIKDRAEIPFNVDTVVGNGYEGNKYVIEDGSFKKETLDTSNRKYINDNDLLTIYEYSRITTSDANNKDFNPDVNYDSIEARCTITISSNLPFNTLRINVSSKDTYLTSLQYSSDGINYYEVLNDSIQINNSDIKYSNVNYIANSGLQVIPNALYAKITLMSNSTTDETIGVDKIEVIEENVTTNEIVTNTSASDLTTDENTYAGVNNDDKNIEDEIVSEIKNTSSNKSSYIDEEGVLHKSNSVEEKVKVYNTSTSSSYALYDDNTIIKIKNEYLPNGEVGYITETYGISSKDYDMIRNEAYNKINKYEYNSNKKALSYVSNPLNNKSSNYVINKINDDTIKITKDNGTTKTYIKTSETNSLNTNKSSKINTGNSSKVIIVPEEDKILYNNNIYISQPASNVSLDKSNYIITKDIYDNSLDNSKTIQPIHPEHLYE